MIIDVRTSGEYELGHVSDSINIPLDVLSDEILKKNIPKDLPIILCCESGGRSSYAFMILQNLGFTNVTDGGSWRNFTN